MSTSEKLVEVLEQKNQLARNLSAMGVSASTSEGLKTLVPKVLNIEGGTGKSVFGAYVPDTYSRVFSLNNIGFEPKFISIVAPDVFNISIHDVVEDKTKRVFSSFFYNLDLVDESNLSKFCGCYVSRAYDSSAGKYNYLGGTLSGSALNPADGSLLTVTGDNVRLDVTKFAAYFVENAPYYYVIHG